MDTSRHLYEIELALCYTPQFNFVKNIVAFNVNGISEILPIFHECDMLILSKSGYLTEIEIKRSYVDFINDFSKKHKHESEYIKFFYYCVPEKILEKVQQYLHENNINCSGVITYSENLRINFHGYYKGDCLIMAREFKAKKLFLEQKLELARLAAIRNISLKKKLLQYIEFEKRVIGSIQEI